MSTTTYFPVIKKPHIPSPSKPPSSSPKSMTIASLPPLSNGLLLSSSSDPLAPIELRLASLPLYPCTAIVSPISQSPSLYPLTHPVNTITTIPSSPLSSQASPSTYTPQPSLPGLIDHLSGPELVQWREEHWPDGLNAGDCGVSPSFRLGDPGNNARNKDSKDTKDDKEEAKTTCIEAHKRPKYIIHTHAPNFADKSYSTPLVKQLLVNCYHGALVEAMRISEKEDELQRAKAEATFADATETETETGMSPDATHRAHPANRLPPTATMETDIDTNLRAITAPIKIATHTPDPNENTGPLPSQQIAFPAPAPAPASSPNPIPRPTSSAPATQCAQGVTLAFPALATGSKCFPHRLAARIAVATVRDFLKHPVFGRQRRKRIRRVVFCVWPVGSPNRKALQIAFGLMFPPPLPQSAPLSPISKQLATPPFTPSPRKRTGGEAGDGPGFGAVVEDGGEGGKAVEAVEAVEKAIVGAEDLGRGVGLSGERVGIGRIGRPALDGNGLGHGTGNENENENENEVTIVGAGVVKGRIRKDSYKQKKRKQGLRLAAVNRERRERGLRGRDQGQGLGLGLGNGDANSDPVNHSATLQPGERHPKTLERRPGVKDADVDGDDVL